MKFVGVDFGWSSGASGLCCLAWQDNWLEILDLTTILEINDILTWIDSWVDKTSPGLVAVDAPTIINNPTGMRLADKLTHKYFGRYHAGCYPANLNLKFAKRTVGLGKSLTAMNFQHAPTIKPKQLGRYQIEVFPPLDRQLTGKELKAIEDMLDSLICAYVAAHWWYWGEAKNLVLGDFDHGYIVIPQAS